MQRIFEFTLLILFTLLMYVGCVFYDKENGCWLFIIIISSTQIMGLTIKRMIQQIKEEEK